MNNIVEFLQNNPVQYLATVGTDGNAKCRPFMFCFEQEGKLWFCTSNKKSVYTELKSNPSFELSISNDKYEWIRLGGKAVFENNMQAKENCMIIPIVKGVYQTASNPDFEVFYLADGKATLADFSGNPPTEYTI